MPGPIVQASPGGICPRTASTLTTSNLTLTEEPRVGVGAHHQHHQKEDEDHGQHCNERHQHHPVGGGDRAATAACIDRMPGPVSNLGCF